MATACVMLKRSSTVTILPLTSTRSAVSAAIPILVAQQQTTRPSVMLTRQPLLRAPICITWRPCSFLGVPFLLLSIYLFSDLSHDPLHRRYRRVLELVRSR